VFFGGSSIATLAAIPDEPWTYAGYERLVDNCKAVKKGIVCDIEDPARLTVGTRNGEVTEDILAGEHLVVEMRKAGIFCRNQ